ncbi:unnamed protein product [Protopolystoma xenopodis]|uniref:Uncharacterized protein n=1 Tax=Protopolystoma xenopodis TaxID=117903 RepID=A0A448WD10_9PLAT|nr:unnamed protein product [Protopolystoma xenopodis]
MSPPNYPTPHQPRTYTSCWACSLPLRPAMHGWIVRWLRITACARVLIGRAWMEKDGIFASHSNSGQVYWRICPRVWLLCCQIYRLSHSSR